MFRKIIPMLMAACLLAGSLAGAASAAETDCDSIYCFTAGDFSSEEEISGICITALPQNLPGQLTLGDRVLVPGDILTQEQVAQMTFQPRRSTTDQVLEMEYLPIYEGRVGSAAVMTLSIRGKEDKAPVAEDCALETYRNLPITGKLKVSDPENALMTYSVIRQPKRGTLEIGADGSFTYTPRKNKVGVDSFQFTAADPAGNISREATVTITILKDGNSPQYSDTHGSHCRFAAEWMKNTGIFVGEQLDGHACFHPQQAVTRGEFITMLVRGLELMQSDDAALAEDLTDVPQWLRPYVAAAQRSGLTAGLPQQEFFDVNAPITGAEAAVMLQNALDLAVGAAAETDDTVPAWARDALTALAGNGMTLLHDQPLTRGDAAVILYDAVRQYQQQHEFVDLTQ